MGKMEKVSVTDLYEACYLLLNGAELETVRCIPAGKNINCELVLCGGSLTDLMDEYYQKNAMVNLFSFRSVYSRVSSAHPQRQALLQEGGAGMTEFITTREVITNNLAEAQFLLERNHKLIGAEYRRTGSYETQELVLTIQGPMVHQDRRGFFIAGNQSLQGLASVLDQIRSLIWKKEEGGEL
jgi:hypothetical protein